MNIRNIIRNIFGVITGPVPVTVTNNNGQAIRERVEFILCLPFLKTDPNNTFKPIKAARISFAYEISNTDGTNLSTYNQRGGHQVLVCEARNTANGVLQAEIGKRKLEMGKVHEGCRKIRSVMIDSLTALLELQFGCALIEPTLSIEFLDRVPEEKSQFVLTGLIVLLGLLILTAIASLLFSKDRQVEAKSIIEIPIPKSEPIPVTPPSSVTRPSNGNGNGGGYVPPQKNEVRPPRSSNPFAFVPPFEDENGQITFFQTFIPYRGVSGFNVVTFTFYDSTYVEEDQRGQLTKEVWMLPGDSHSFEAGVNNLTLKFNAYGSKPAKISWIDRDKVMKVEEDPLGGGQYPIYKGKKYLF